MAKNGKRGVVTYKSYMFVDKDPIIDALRTAVADAKITYKDLHEKSDVSVTTYSSWFNGKTRRPQFGTVAATARALGKRSIRFHGNRPILDD